MTIDLIEMKSLIYHIVESFLLILKHLFMIFPAEDTINGPLYSPNQLGFNKKDKTLAHIFL